LPLYPPPVPLRVTVADAISDLPNIDGFQVLISTDSVKHRIRPKSHYAKVLHGIAADGTDFSYVRE
jgi:DNA (cytosine-5)-methyltransferase 1